jgi:hypothetical protein
LLTHTVTNYLKASGGTGNHEKVQDGTELERVESWRREALVRAGYSPEAAVQLAARHDVDLHAAVQLLERGCPADVAVRILL